MTLPTFYVRDRDGGIGTGWAIGGGYALTASHVVYTSGAGAIPAGPKTPITYSMDMVSFYNARLVDYNAITTEPAVTITGAGLDYAILELDPAHMPPDAPMRYFPDYTGGPVTVSGYPGGAVGQLSGRANPEPGVQDSAPYRSFQIPYAAPGFSGGPVWVQTPTGPVGVGLVSLHSGTDFGIACALTKQTIRDIEDALAKDGASPRVARVYRFVFGRAPDPSGLMYWTAKEAQYGLDAVILGMMQSPEYQSLFVQLSLVDILAAVYFHILGRPPDPAGLAYWEAQPQLSWAIAGITQSVEAISNIGAGL